MWEHTPQYKKETKRRRKELKIVLWRLLKKFMIGKLKYCQKQNCLRIVVEYIGDLKNQIHPKTEQTVVQFLLGSYNPVSVQFTLSKPTNLN